MSTLIAIGDPDENTAAAGDEAEELASELIIQPDAIAVIRRDVKGKYTSPPAHHPVGGGTTQGHGLGHVRRSRARSTLTSRARACSSLSAVRVVHSHAPVTSLMGSLNWTRYSV
jgi:hypothetical protein